MALAIWWFLAMAAEPKAGYEAEVVSANCFALSGPGEGYYPTQLLTPGQAVTVIGSRRGDWLAIEPPKGSFSWIPSDKIQLDPSGTGIVQEDGTKIRVGSQLSDAHHVFQVSLKKGDKVSILDHAYLRDAEKIGEWYKIVPPADEVRYVAAAQIQPRGAREGVNIARGQIGATADPAPPPSTDNQVIPPAKPIRVVSANDASPRNREGTSARLATAKSSRLADGEAASIPAFADDPAKPLAARLKSLRDYLENMRTREPSSWDTERLRPTLDKLRADVKTPEDKQQLLEIEERTQQLADLEGRYERLMRRRELALRRDEELALLQKRKEQAISGLVQRFNAQGLLDRSVIAVDGKQTFSIKNAEGTVTHYVVAAPGLNLQRYLGRSIGIVGTVSDRPGMPVPVVQATQLTPLEDPFAAARTEP